MSHDDDGENPAPRSGALTYAVMTAEARRQAALPRPTARRRREADVRTVRWWRIRTLRSISGLSTLVTALVFACLVLVICLLVGSSIMPDAWYPLVVSVGLALYGAYRLRGVPGATARTLASAACAPGPVPKRYALVYDPPWGGIALLVLFPADGGDDVQPDAVLELMPLPEPWLRFPGASKLPADLPVEPAGNLELRGARDGLPMGIPWIDGQAYWPKRSYGPDDLMGGEGRALILRLLADATAEADSIDL
ncbi:hypothetical protein ACFXAW_00160 [Streptomyces sp. NPDC059445]|uniref:hypothetical protein n=1 Tax=Streptomyces sp. NPDC059445 TaxID=3346832 RepID=UPI003686B939